jgi:hypothetical protein
MRALRRRPCNIDLSVLSYVTAIGHPHFPKHLPFWQDAAAVVPLPANERYNAGLAIADTASYAGISADDGAVALERKGIAKRKVRIFISA